MIGKSLGQYQIVDHLGTGGMGEVYRGHDPNLKRDVAIKVLREEVAEDPERLARLEREAQLLAQLEHANIAAIYGLEQATPEGGEGEPVRFLVMQLAEGQTLAERIAAGPMGVEESLKIAIEITKGLEAAHDKGIVHRDLKPDNVKFVEDDAGNPRVKILDFGLAKAYEAEPATEGISPQISRSPTALASPLADATAIGTVLGTASYMSPEQARGKPVDRRTDIWAFGCVLYEMLTGRRPFSGSDAAETIAAILKDRPDWDALPAATTALVRSLLRRCMRRDPGRRLHDIADARIEIEEALAEPEAPTEAAAAASPRSVLPWVAMIAVAAIASAALTWQLAPRGASNAVERWNVALPDGHRVAPGISNPQTVAISPDGNLIVYRGTDGVTPQLYMRAIDESAATPVPGTEGGWGPFFSPDSQWLGFIVEGSIYKVSVQGGPVVPVVEIRGRAYSAAWGSDDFIVYAVDPGPQAGLSRVSAAGGTPEPVTTLDRGRGERAHYAPQLLPDGTHVLFHIREQVSNDTLAVAALDTGEIKILLEGASAPTYLPTGHLVYATDGTLLVQPFDLATLELRGQSVPVVEQVVFDPTSGHADYDVASNGTLVYVAGGLLTGLNFLEWVDASGQRTIIDRPLAAHEEPRVSPDGRQYAVTVFDGSQHDVWVYDLEGTGSLKLTIEASNRSSVWDPSGEWIYFTTTRQASNYILARKPADGSGDAELLLPSENNQTPGDVSRDGRELIYVESNPDTGWDIWGLPLEGERTPREIIRSGADEVRPRLSPDGRWLAFQEVSEPGTSQLFVQPYPGPGAKRQISFNGGESPVWAKDGSALYFMQESRIMVAQIETSGRFSSSRPEVALDDPSLSSLIFSHAANFETMPDGRLLIVPREIDAPGYLNVVLNFFEEVKERVPTGR